ncbi:SAM-dependent methyltransferase [Chelativorans sp.]|uniref:protein-L-isoaspartate O-methyltransferase family protein n=1 Tax=Chelativorans sp. TaxID=2203393 RepID=UPI002810F69F|nr:SAM-dependent methyltransferase [Chelativorans sp.]
MEERELEIIRAAFARQMVAVAGVAENAALEAAFRAVRREDFLGSKPWAIIDFEKGRRPLPSNDPVYAYQDVVIVLSGERGVNNGSPSLHARMLTALAPEPGQTVVHLGAGTGYYSAILSHLVGPTGKVIAVEIDPRLARKRKPNCGLSVMWRWSSEMPRIGRWKRRTAST